MIHFPAIVKFEGQDELIYVADAKSYTDTYRLHAHYFTQDDRLIDAKGKVWPLSQLTVQHTELIPEIRQLDMPELTALIQAHFFAVSQNCLLKIQARTMAELIGLVGAA